MSRLSKTLTALSLAPALEASLSHFTDLFQKWNRSINLSAARTEADLVDHVVDSLHVVPHLHALIPAPSSELSVLDVGAGGGLPAVVVAICLPDTLVTALEPIHKKHAFLRTAARELSLANLEAHATRLEDHTRHDYDVAMSRATFDLREWLLLGLARVRHGGTAIGFEAVPRQDLPTGTRRFPYALDDKSRAIVTLQHT